MSTPSDTDTRCYCGGSLDAPCRHCIDRAARVVPTISDAETHIETDTPLSGKETEGDTKAPAQGGKLAGGMDAREMALRRWALERSRKEEETDALTHARQDEVLVVRTTVATGHIIKRLEKDAKGGSTQAARELRAWLSELPIETDTDISALDRRTRQAVLAKLLEQVEDDDRAFVQQTEPTETGATPPTSGTPYGSMDEAPSHQ